MITLAQIAQNVGAVAHGDTELTGVTHDSRLVRPGDLYIAVPGAHHHGIEFLDAAVAAGAVAVASDSDGVARVEGLPWLRLDDVRAQMGAVASAVLGHPERKLVIAGVTGTNGKTTSAFMLAHILRASGKSVGVIGTLGAMIGDEVIPGARTTPEATDLYTLFTRMGDAGVTHVVMEVSSHGLALHRVAGVRFAVGMFTNLTQDHLDFHGDMESYFAAKASLFEVSDAAVINVGDVWGTRLAAQVPAADTVGGSWQVADVRNRGSAGLTFTLTGERQVPVDLPMIGGFNADNAALAILAAARLGIDLEMSAASLATFPGVPGRLERVETGSVDTFVDYAHTPDAVARVLDVLDSVTSGSLITVMGCGGDRDPGKRAEMGRIAAATSDVVVVTDDNPRSEDPVAIRSAVLAGTRGGRARVVEIGDRREAIRYSLSVAQPGDVVAVLGKGHEQGQEIAGVVLPFDDRDVIRQESGHA